MTSEHLAPTGPEQTPSPPSPPSPALPSGAARERVIQALCLHFASDHLSMDELERRLELAYKATSATQLDGLVSDLPSLREEDAPDSATPAVLAPASQVPRRGVLLAVLGATTRRGSWLVPRHLKVFAIMGGAKLDLREARFAQGVTEIDVTAVMSGVEIIVPPGVRVECLGGAFLGGFEVRSGDVPALGTPQPVIRLSGVAIMAGVEARVKQPRDDTLIKFKEAWEAVRTLPGRRRR
jgi:hypothetical protein